jgi:hypothetical protein
LAKLVDCRHITGKHFEHSALVQDIMVFLKECAERGGVRKAFKRCVGAMCCWSGAGASQQQRKQGQDTQATRPTPPAARPANDFEAAPVAALDSPSSPASVSSASGDFEMVKFDLRPDSVHSAAPADADAAALAVPSPTTWGFNCCIAEIKAQNSVGSKVRRQGMKLRGFLCFERFHRLLSGKRCRWRASLSSLSRLRVACGSSLLSRLASWTGGSLRLPLLLRPSKRKPVTPDASWCFWC